MFCLKSPSEINKLEYINRLNAELLSHLYSSTQIDVTTLELEEIVIKFCEKNLVNPTFKGYEGFPGYMCISVNDEIIHGIPSSRLLKRNDIVSIDCGLDKDGYYSDSAFTKLLGNESKRNKLVVATESALAVGISNALSGGRLFDISRAIENVANNYGYSVVKDFVGHGTGFALHEFPNVPNYVSRGTNWLLRPGMVLAIEPMFIDGDYDFYFDENGWTVKTTDGGMASHFEHTIAILDNGPKILSKL